MYQYEPLISYLQWFIVGKKKLYLNKLPVPKTRFLYVHLWFCSTLRHEHLNTLNL